MEIYILVLSLLITDDTQEHTGIRAFYTEDECNKFIPAYVEFVSLLDNPGNISRAEITCIMRKT